MFSKLRPQKNKSVSFIIFIFFLLAFLGSRLLVYFFPNFHLFNTSAGSVHHLVYGIILISVIGYISLVMNLNEKNRMRFAVLYGIGLGLAYDEFAMWLKLEDVYYDRRSYDIVLVLALIMLNLVYFSEFWKKWGKRMNKLFRIIVVTAPRGMYRVVVRMVSK